MNAKNAVAEYDVPSTGLRAALVFVVSLNLRPAIAAVGPLLTQIGADLSWAFLQCVVAVIAGQSSKDGVSRSIGS